MPTDESLIPKHGGYRNLKSFQIAQLAYDLTVRFCDRYVSKFSRTKDQMIQAARSGVQNIAEGSLASGTSKKTELKLTNVARSSLEELLLDYEDFLRQHSLPKWDRRDLRRQRLVDQGCMSVDEVVIWIKEEVVKAIGRECGHRRHRRQSRQGGRSKESGPSGQQGLDVTQSTESTESTLFQEYSANAALVLIPVACYLLDRQSNSLAKAFENEGGFTERLYRVRTQKRKQK
jgi:four helix bundle suffix protein